MKRIVNSAVAVFMLSLLSGVVAQDKGQEKKQDADPLAEKSEWKGKLTQKGTIKGDAVPPSFDVVLVVTKRTAAEFECELRERVNGSHVTYVCKGSSEPDKKKGGLIVAFVSVDVKTASENFFVIYRVPYSGAISGNTFTGTWKFPPNKDGIDLEGDFKLERQ